MKMKVMTFVLSSSVITEFHMKATDWQILNFIQFNGTSIYFVSILCVQTLPYNKCRAFGS